MDKCGYQQVAIYIILLIFCTATNISFGDVSMSIMDVQRMVDNERKIIDILQMLLDAEEEKVAHIKSYISWFKEFTAISDVELAVSHPVNAFHLIRHLSVDWEHLRQFLTHDLSQAAAMDIEVERALGNFPKEEDIKGAALGILRLQKTYKIDTETFVGGNIHGIFSVQPLGALDCYLIGREIANEENDYNFAIGWLETALGKSEQSVGTKPQVRREEILDWLQYIYQQNGDLLTAMALSAMIADIDSSYPGTDENIRAYAERLNNMTDDQLETIKNWGPLQPPVSHEHFEALCRGEEKESANPQPLRCFHETHNNPFLILQPIKLEVLHVDPDIFIVHDAVRGDQMDRLRCVSRPYIASELVIEPESYQVKLSRVRVAKRADLPESLDPVIKTLNTLAGHYANLNASQAEDLHVTNYGIGGHFSPHTDFYTPVGMPTLPWLGSLGDRIATFMVYLTDVEAGGATVFPELNVTIFPKKGSAAFWYNQHLDGTGDVRTVHSGCPILFGSKWLMNKWFRQAHQDVTRPCALHQDSMVR